MTTHEIIVTAMRGIGWAVLLWLVPFAFYDSGRNADNNNIDAHMTPFFIGLAAYIILLLCLIGSVRP
jgi:hypothetical protein